VFEEENSFAEVLPYLLSRQMIMSARVGRVMYLGKDGGGHQRRESEDTGGNESNVTTNASRKRKE
jgi:hypothetical protein